MVYGHPRHLHFHTCGDYAPGEISWHLLDATIAFDGEVLWRDGRLTLLEGEEVRALLRRHGVREDYFADYLPRVLANPIARAVKLADATHNLARGGNLPPGEARTRLKAKYERVIATIEGAPP